MNNKNQSKQKAAEKPSQYELINSYLGKVFELGGFDSIHKGHIIDGIPVSVPSDAFLRITADHHVSALLRIGGLGYSVTVDLQSSYMEELKILLKGEAFGGYDAVGIPVGTDPFRVDVITRGKGFALKFPLDSYDIIGKYHFGTTNVPTAQTGFVGRKEQQSFCCNGRPIIHINGPKIARIGNTNVKIDSVDQLVGALITKKGELMLDAHRAEAIKAKGSDQLLYAIRNTAKALGFDVDAATLAKGLLHHPWMQGEATTVVKTEIIVETLDEGLDLG